MTSPTPCDHCPAPDPARCPAVLWPHPRFCEIADRSHPDHGLLAGYLPVLLAAASDPAAAPADPDAVDPIAVAIDLCPHRRSCQCREPIACGHPDRPGLVTLADCRACKSGA